MTIAKYGLTLAIAIVVLLSAAHPARAAGPGFSTPPSWEECFANSQSIVIGKVTRVDADEVLIKGKKQTDVTFDLQIRAVLYGRVKGESISFRERGLHASAPKKGEIYIACLKKPGSIAWQSRSADDVVNLFYKLRVEKFSVPRMTAIRREGKIWLMEEIDQQVAAIKAGCFSANREFRNWCLHKLTGKGWKNVLFPIHLHIDQREARQIVLKSMMSDADDGSFVRFGISLIYNKTDFPESEACYRLLMGLLDHYDSRSRTDDHDRFPIIMHSLYSWFPDKGATTVPRLGRFVTDSKMNRAYRNTALHSIGRYFASGNEALQNRILDITEPYLYREDKPLSEVAGIVIAQIAVGGAKRGEVPPRIAGLLQNTGKMTERASSRVMTARRRSAKILASPPKSNEANDTANEKRVGNKTDRTPIVLEGWYHQTCWGVGRLEKSYLHPKLLERMAPYEGRYVRLNVTKSRATTSPGKCVILAVDKIDPKPQPPIGIRMHTWPKKIKPGQPFQMVVVTTSRIAKGLVLYPMRSRMVIYHPYPLPKDYPLSKFETWRRNEPSPFVKEYSRRQLYLRETTCGWNNWDLFAGRSNFSFNLFARDRIKIALLPGGSHAWIVVVRKGLPIGKHEAKFQFSWVLADPTKGSRHPTSKGELVAWHRIDVSGVPTNDQKDKAGASEEAISLTASDVEITPVDSGGHGLRFRLRSVQGKPVRVPTETNSVTGQINSDKFATTARLIGFTASGSPVELVGSRLPWRRTPQRAIRQLQTLPKEGVVVQGKFRKQSRFAPVVTRLVVRVATGHGVEDVVLTDKLHDNEDASATPFGPVTSGVKLRIRPAKKSFKQAEQLVFYLQAVNVSGKPVSWWRPDSESGKNVIVEIDGRRIEPPKTKPNPIDLSPVDEIGPFDDTSETSEEQTEQPEPESVDGWFAKHTRKTPKEQTVKIPKDIRLAKGRHTLRYVITSGGGTRENTFGDRIPVIKGKIVSNKIEFAVD